jgi:hypothetical protein
VARQKEFDEMAENTEAGAVEGMGRVIPFSEVDRRLSDALAKAYVRIDELEKERDRLRAMAGAITARASGQIVNVIEAARQVSNATFSHIDGSDLLARLHPRRQLDIKRRVDGVETWYQGDWLSTLWDARKKLDEVLKRIDP